jgi:hypothetical protein
MTELDQVWSEMLGAAGERAAAEGRQHLADYLRLRATNDAIRTQGVKWLFATVIEHAAEAQRTRNITIEREDPYSFRRGNSTMVGSALFIRNGVRCLTVDAGWARTPSHGIMQKGALAYARLSHFGMPRSNTELRLVFEDSLPNWRDEKDHPADADLLKAHVDLLLA